jgi:hypothetical protein
MNPLGDSFHHYTACHISVGLSSTPFTHNLKKSTLYEKIARRKRSSFERLIYTGNISQDEPKQDFIFQMQFGPHDIV